MKQYVPSFDKFLNENLKYNTVEKVVKKIGRQPSEQDVAKFVINNYNDITGENVKNIEDMDFESSDKIADIISFYKFDKDDWVKAIENEVNKKTNESISFEDFLNKKKNFDFSNYNDKTINKITSGKWFDFSKRLPLNKDIVVKIKNDKYKAAKIRGDQRNAEYSFYDKYGNTSFWFDIKKLKDYKWSYLKNL